MTKKRAFHPSDLLNSYHLLAFDELDSTNEEAKRLARAGGSHGAVIWAKRQTSGKGRMGRSWVSPEGNLFVSILLQPGKDVKQFAQISFVAAVAAAESLIPLLPPGRKLRLKWPNDILLDDKKLGGILLESFQTETGQSWVVVGIGLNVERFPTETEFPATCLKDAGVELISAKIVLSRLVHHFIETYNEWDAKEFAPIRKAWTSHAWGIGKPLRARLPDGEITGVAEGIDDAGSLILTLPDGKKRYIHAADIFPAGPVRRVRKRKSHVAGD